MYTGAGAGAAHLSHAPVTALGDALAGLDEAWSGALPSFGVVTGDGDPSVVVEQFSDAGLLAVVGAVGALTRRVETLGAVVAAEVARRSPTGSREGNLARTEGYASPGRLIAASRGGQVGRAAELVKVGQATAARRTLSGEPLPAAHPHVADALHAGRISVDAAQVIIAMLDRVAPRANPLDVETTERLLATQAAQFPLHQVENLVRHAEARLDPDGIAPKEEHQRAARSLTMRQDSQGMFHLRGALDPVTGAPIKTALDAYVAARLRETRGNNYPDTPGTVVSARSAGSAGSGGSNTDEDSNTIETRTIPQLQADALADFARHVLACDTTVPLVPAVTMVVRIELADLEASLRAGGYATIDGVDQPLSAAAARQLACDAGLIPAVFGGPSLPLDLGRRSRTFTRAQVLALWERDGGCAFCGQTTFVEAHHIAWWHRDRGTTDLTNGVLLCSRCHHLIHRDGWGIKVSETGEVTFTPPRVVDPDQVPRPAAPNPRRLGAQPTTPPSRPPDRDDTRRPPDRDDTTRPPDRDDARRPPAGPGRTTPRAERTSPATDERRRE